MKMTGISWLGKQGRKLVSADIHSGWRQGWDKVVHHKFMVRRNTAKVFCLFLFAFRLFVYWFVFEIVYFCLRSAVSGQMRQKRTAFTSHQMEIYTLAEKAVPFKLCSRIPLAAHGISHSLCDKPQGGAHNALSALCIPHTQGSGSISTKADSFSVTSLSLQSNARGRCKPAFTSWLSFLVHWNEQNGVGQLAVTTF